MVRKFLAGLLSTLSFLLVLGFVALLVSSAVRRNVGQSLVETGTYLQGRSSVEAPSREVRVQAARSESLNDIRLKHLEDSEARFQSNLTIVGIILGALGLMIASLSYFGLNWLKETLAIELTSKTEKTYKELRGRIYNVYAVIYGKLSRNERDEVIPGKEFFLEQALHFAARALKEMAEAGDKDAIWNVKNNLAYYRSLKYNPAFANEALQLAEELRNEYPRRGADNWADTYGRVQATYWQEAPEAAERLDYARKILQHLVTDPGVSVLRKNILGRTLTLVKDAIQLLPARPPLSSDIKRLFLRVFLGR